MYNYIDKLNKIPFRKVSVGYRIVTLYDAKQIEGAQVGYATDLEGNDLTGVREGDWCSSWMVIGYEDETGDPIFIDLNSRQFCVYTAMHGQGQWDPTLLSQTLDGFIDALKEIANISEGRGNPVELEDNPLDEDQKARLLERISNLVSSDELDFWESWLEC